MDDPNHTGFKELPLSIKSNKVLKRIEDFWEKITKKYSLNKILAGFMFIVIAGVLLTTYKINEIKTRAFIVYFGDEKVGIVREQEEALNILNDIKRELTSTYDINIVLKDDISFEDTHSKDDVLATPDEIKRNIRSKMTFLVSGYVLLVNNEEIGATKTKQDMEEVIENIKKPYLDNKEENSHIKEVKFIEDVKIEKRNIPLNKIIDKDKLLQHVQTGGEEIKTHIVEVGESLWTIAKIYDMSVEDLIAANPDRDPEKLQIGDEVKLLVPKSMVTIATVEEVKYTEKVDYEVKLNMIKYV